MHIRNELSMMLILHCQSGDDDLHARVIPVGSEFTWLFTLTGGTLFWCDLAVQDKRVHIDVVDGEKYYPLYWVVKDDGIYGNEPGRLLSLEKILDHFQLTTLTVMLIN
ncbi:hypothetical protein LINPERHAP1_LOCUS24255 [Linum perenne]